MTPKDLLTNRSFCPVPWTGFYVDMSGDVKNCICSYESIGNLKDSSIQEIVTGAKNTETQRAILSDQRPHTCSYCYGLEENKRSFDVVSSRVYYLRELKSIPLETYQPGQFDLHQVDVRWSNTCNHACVYCGPVLSSRWADELAVRIDQPTDQRKQQLRDYIFSNVKQIKNIYLAGGEPLLMRENEEFLQLLLDQNPGVSLRVNTNLSKTNTRVLDLIQQFEKVHWTVSAESIGSQFEYIRYGGSWLDFLTNLDQIRKTNHKITFNMVWCVLNHRGLFKCIDFMRDLGFHSNAFILTAILGPGYLDIRHLPKNMLQSLQSELESRIAKQPGYLLEDGYHNLLRHIQHPFNGNWAGTDARLAELDVRRNLNRHIVFKELYKEINHGNHKTI